jgi:threonine dehydrogenase-like Zn-dependent dehydrogenase
MMSEIMKGLQIEAPGKPVWKEMPVPVPAKDEVLIKVLGVTTCPHWDMHIMDGVPMFPDHDLSYPYQAGQPGHEAMGEVVGLGTEVEHLEIGQRVVAWRDTGEKRQGFYAQYNVFRERDVLAIDSNFIAEQIASLELAMCVQVSFDQLIARDAIAGKRIGLGGLGPAGLVAVQMAKAYGAAEVIAFDFVEERCELARRLGADFAGEPDSETFPQKRSGDKAFDSAVDLTGLPVSIQFLMDRTRDSVAIFGVLREEVRFGMPHLFGPGLTLMGYGDHNRAAAERALGLVQEGKLNLNALVSTSMPLSEYALGVEKLRKKEAIKVCFLPWA